MPRTTDGSSRVATFRFPPQTGLSRTSSCPPSPADALTSSRSSTYPRCHLPSAAVAGFGYGGEGNCRLMARSAWASASNTTASAPGGIRDISPTRPAMATSTTMPGRIAMSALRLAPASPASRRQTTAAAEAHDTAPGTATAARRAACVMRQKAADVPWRPTTGWTNTSKRHAGYQLRTTVSGTGDGGAWTPMPFPDEHDTTWHAGASTASARTRPQWTLPSLPLPST